ncbi:MAG: hypothetical protein ACOX4B_09885 [Bacillota bacterium]|jgi:hypothetical protein|nr:hypothetical protein [Candidatus Fermentithermobacillaceae bacterium]
MRFRSGPSKNKLYLWALMGAAGAVILLISLPSWVILALLGAGLIAGAFYGYKSGL